MTAIVNKIRNPNLVAGSAGPRSWIWSVSSGRARWEVPVCDERGSALGLRMVTEKGPATAMWTQTAGCKPRTYYRVESVVRCDLAAPNESNGFVLRIQPLEGGRPVGRQLCTPGVHSAKVPITVRTVFKVPDGIRSVAVSAGVDSATGWVDLLEVRFIAILEPDEESHLLATPPPPVSVPVPRVARTVCVCTADGHRRPLVPLLSSVIGSGNVCSVSHSDFRPDAVREDALFFPDAMLPKSIKSLRSLSRLAAERIVVVSLPAFARLIGPSLSLRRIEQADDPICAKVAFANHASRGFALHDVFAHSWEGTTGGSNVQNQFKNSPSLKDFCRRHGFEVLLQSMCDTDAASHQPIALYKPTGGGSLYVFDVEPVEAGGSTLSEPNLALHWLLSVLGLVHVGLGQYVVPHAEEADFRGFIRDMGDRFDGFEVHDAEVPTTEVTEQLVTIGREDRGFGLPLMPKPVILVRSGLSSGDVLSVYSALLWFKQLVKVPPHSCPYVEPLASQFRLAWIPCAAPWEAGSGRLRSGEPPTAEFDVEVEENLIAALIDIVSVPVNRTRVVVPIDDARFDGYQRWLPKLAQAFPPGRYFASQVRRGATFTDRREFEPRFSEPGLEVVADPACFAASVYQRVLDCGGQVIRIEIPGCDADISAHSIQRTDIGATTLEHVVGLQFGLIAVNRLRKAVQLDGFAPVPSGKSLIINQTDPMLRTAAAHVG